MPRRMIFAARPVLAVAGMALFLLAAEQGRAQPGGGTVQFNKLSYSVSESSPSATIMVDRVGATNGTVTVQFRTEPQTAMPGVDYSPTNGTLVFQPGQTKATFAVRIIADALKEDEEGVTLILENVAGGLLGQDNATLKILDDDTCTLSLAPTGRTHTYQAVVSNIVVTATGGCPWAATANVNWIGILTGRGTNDGVVQYSIDANTNITARSGRITVARKIFTVAQEGAPPPDVTRPIVTIVSPAVGARLTNTTEVVVTGKATDSRGVTEVQFRLENYAGTNDYQTAAGTSNWSAHVSGLLKGTNTVRVRARDAANNLSAEVARSFVSVVASPLSVWTNGEGVVTPALNGQWLEVGRTYMLTATPRPRNLFTGWTGSITSSAATLVFQMQSNLLLQANFVTNPFIAVKGSYNGLLSETAVRHNTSGFFSAKTTEAATFTAKLLVAGKPASFSGRFALDGKATNTVSRAGTNALTVLLTLDLHGDSDQITGLVIDPNWTASLVAYRAGLSGATNFNGKHTLIILGGADAAASPAGDSFGTATVAGGIVSFSGLLADGTPVRQKVPLSKEGDWPLYAPLYGGHGSIFSRIKFAGDELNGPFNWTKPMLAGAKFYSGGFAVQTGAAGSSYVPPTGLTSILPQFTRGVASFSGGNLVESFVNDIELTNGSKVVNLSNNRLVITFVKPSGRFNGVVTDPNNARTIPFKGVVHQEGKYGAGFFLGTSQSGSVRLEPAP